MDLQEALAYIMTACKQEGLLLEGQKHVLNVATNALRRHVEWATGPRAMVLPGREIRTYRGTVAVLDQSSLGRMIDPAFRDQAWGVWDLQGLALEAGATMEQIQAGKVNAIITLSYGADGQ